MKRYLFGFVFSLIALGINAQTTDLQVTAATNVTPLVNQLFTGCSQVLSVNASGNMLSRGSFTNGMAAIGMQSGIILSTGKITDANTANFNGSTFFTYNFPGDATLASYYGMATTYDAASITITTVAQGDKMELRYVFASEGYEYDYTNQGKPEGVGIFVTGPAPFAAPYNNYNIALVPGTNTPVCIDSVNSGINSHVYNQTMFGSALMQYDGFTDPLTASFFTVPCQTYTIKIVVADFNKNFDSAVFIEAGSIKSDFVMDVSYLHSAGVVDQLYEGCEGTFVFSRVNMIDSLTPIPFNVTFSGAALEGQDFAGFSSGSYVLPAGSAYMSIDFTAIIDNIVEGNENLIVTISHAGICDPNCTASYSYEIDIVDNFELDAGIVQNDSNICAYATSFVNLTTFIPTDMNPYNVSYQWNTGHTTPNISASPPIGQCTDYRVTITDVCGQEAVDSIRICNSSLMSISVATVDNLCFGESKGSVLVTPDGGFDPLVYSWTPSNLGLNNSGMIENMLSGNYSVTVTDSIGCFRTSNFIINQPDSIYYSLTAFSPLCHNYQDGSVLMQLYNGVPPYNYQWSTGATTSGINLLGSGTYSVTATDQNDCMIVDTAVLINPAPLWMGVSNDTWACKGKNTVLSAWVTGGTPAYFYSWSNGASGPNITVNPTQNAIYTVQAHDLNGCETDVKQIQVSVYPDINLELQTLTDSICVGESAIIHATILGGTGGPYFVEIFDGASTELLPPPYTVSPGQTTEYEISVKDFCDLPPAQDDITIYVFEGPEVSIVSDKVAGCQPLKVTFNETTAPIGSSYHWSFGDGEFDLLQNEKNPYHTYQNDGFYDVTLEVTSPIGCKTVITETRYVEVYVNPVAAFYPSPAVVSILKPIVLFQNTSLNSEFNTWNFGDGSVTSDAISPEHYFHEPGEYIVELLTETSKGCKDTHFQKVIVENQYTFYVPNAIDPHSSIPENRYFLPKGEGLSIDDYHLSIYDRWGNKVFETFDVNRYWDGTVGGEVKAGKTYTWIIQYKDLKGQHYTRSGSVTVVN